MSGFPNRSAAPLTGAALDGAISGSQRHAYHRRPQIPLMKVADPELRLAKPEEENTDIELKPDDQEIPLKRDCGIQTVFRDSEAQTDPYTPDFIIPEGTNPEIAQLASLSYGEGLPVGLAEVEMIERARANQAFEESLPQGTDARSFAKRKKMMENQEQEQWAVREKEIDDLQENRLNLLVDALEERNRKRREAAEAKIQLKREQAQMELDNKMALIETKRVKALRTMTKQQRRQPTSVKRDIISEYSKADSNVYAGTTRLGKQGIQIRKQAELQVPAQRTLDGATELERTLGRSNKTMFRSQLGKQSKKLNTSSRIEQQRTLHLEHVTQTLSKPEPTEAEMRATKKDMLPNWRNRGERIVRPETPNVKKEDPDAEATHNAIVLIQRLLRGRAVQNMMFEAKERRADLIKEVHGVDPSVCKALEDRQKRRYEERQKKLAIESVTAHAHGEVVSGTFELFSKELTRRQAFEKISNDVKEADMDRQKREDTEEEKRKKEQEEQRRREKVFVSVARVQREFAQNIINQSLMESIDNVVANLATKQTEEADRLLSKLDSSDPEQFSTTMLNNVMIPLIERKDNERKAEIENIRFVNASRQLLQEALSKIVIDEV